MKSIYKHILWWFSFPFVGILNGVLREVIYKKLVGDLPAHQISTVTGVLFFGSNFLFHFQKMENRICKTRNSCWRNLAWINNSI